jgi:hypothetical protein
VGIRPAGKNKKRLRDPLLGALVFVGITAVLFWIIISRLGQYVTATRTLTYSPIDQHLNSSIQVTLASRGIIWGLGPYQLPEPPATVTFEVPGVSSLQVTGDFCRLDGGSPLPMNASAVAAWVKAARFTPAEMLSKQFIDDVLASSVAVRDHRLEDVGFANLQSQGLTYNASGGGLNPLKPIFCIGGLIWILLARIIFKSSRVRTARWRGQGRCGRCQMPQNLQRPFAARDANLICEIRGLMSPCEFRSMVPPEN